MAATEAALTTAAMIRLIGASPLTAFWKLLRRSWRRHRLRGGRPRRRRRTGRRRARRCAGLNWKRFVIAGRDHRRGCRRPILITSHQHVVVDDVHVVGKLTAVLPLIQRDITLQRFLNLLLQRR